MKTHRPRDGYACRWSRLETRRLDRVTAVPRNVRILAVKTQAMKSGCANVVPRWAFYRLSYSRIRTPSARPVTLFDLGVRFETASVFFGTHRFDRGISPCVSVDAYYAVLLAPRPE